MKKMINNKWFLVAITLLVGITIGWFISNKSISTSAHQHRSPSENQKISTSNHQMWTCSMHPQIRKSEPGKCPICGMELIPLPSDEGVENAMEIKMSPTAMQLANVQTEMVEKKKPVKSLRLNGKIQIDERNIYSQTSHLSGRIEQLFINYTGEYVNKGQVLGTIYSSDLVTAQEELFQANKIKDSQPALFNAAKEKLKNWKLSDREIANILKSGKPNSNFPIHADRSGIVSSKKVSLGDYIKQGEVLYEIADLSSLWVLFDVYEADMQWVKVGDEIEYTIQSLPGEKFKGKINFIDPIINAKTRVAKARVIVKNKSEKLKPEMFVSGTLESPLKAGEPAIIIPKTAVMWTGEKSVVYVKTSEEKGVNFQLRQVVLGPSLGDSFVINKGLDEGEEIAVNGTFSIDAAAQLAGKPSMMNPEGGVVITGHNHGGGNNTATSIQDHSTHSKSISISKEVKGALIPLFDSYITLKNALVNDEFAKAIEAGKNFETDLGKVNMSIFKGESHDVWMKHSSAAKRTIYALNNSKDIKSLRKHFVSLSEQMVMLAKTFEPTQKTLYIQHCPMADEDKGADWISNNKEIENPYFGAAMLKCGEVKQEIK